MRPKFVFALLLSLLLVLGVAIFLKQHSLSPISVQSAPTVGVAPTPTPVAASAPVAVKKNMTPEEKEAAVNAEKERLFDWEVNNDSQSLSNILGDLVSPEKEIRMAAIEATKQFGSTNAIPVLKAMAANTDDTEEQTALLEAADFLALTPISDPSIQHPLTPEQLEANRQRQLARQQAHQQNLQNHHSDQNQNPQPAPTQP